MNYLKIRQLRNAMMLPSRHVKVTPLPNPPAEKQKREEHDTKSNSNVAKDRVRINR